MNDLQDLIDQWGDGLTLAARAYPETFIAGFLEAARKWAALQGLVESGEAGRIIIRAGIKAHEPQAIGGPLKPVSHWPAWRDDLLLDLGIIDKVEIWYAAEHDTSEATDSVERFKTRRMNE